MTDQTPKASGKQKAGLAGIVGTVAAATLIAFTGGQEGVSLTPYVDRLAASHVQTVCFGETNVQMQAYTLDQCKQMLAASLVKYAEGVRDSTPGFDSLTDGQKVAAIDFGYNAGLANWHVSTARRMYVAKQFPAACEQFLQWKWVGNKDCSIKASNCSGIWSRRTKERSYCLGETLPQ